MIKNKKDAMEFMHKKDYETGGKHRWANHHTFQTWLDEMLNEIFAQTDESIEQDAQIIAKKFGVKAMQEINAICVDAPINIDMLADFVRYRIEVKKPLKTARPLKQFAQELITIETAGYSAIEAIEVMKNAEWTTVKLAWIKKTLSTKQGGADLAQFGFGAGSTQELLK